MSQLSDSLGRSNSKQSLLGQRKHSRSFLDNNHQSSLPNGSDNSNMTYVDAGNAIE